MLNGIAAIVAIQAAGLAVAQALWSGLSVLVAFLWGVAVFHERVQCMPLAVAGDMSERGWFFVGGFFLDLFEPKKNPPVWPLVPAEGWRLRKVYTVPRF